MVGVDLILVTAFKKSKITSGLTVLKRSFHS